MHLVLQSLAASPLPSLKAFPTWAAADREAAEFRELVGPQNLMPINERTFDEHWFFHPAGPEGLIPLAGWHARGEFFTYCIVYGPQS